MQTSHVTQLVTLLWRMPQRPSEEPVLVLCWALGAAGSISLCTIGAPSKPTKRQALAAWLSERMQLHARAAASRQ